MRKLLLLLFFLGLCFVTVYAEPIQLFTSDGKEIQPNSTIKLQGHLDDNAHEIAVFISNLQSSGGQLIIEQNILNQTNQAESYFYWNNLKSENKQKNFIAAYEEGKELVFEYIPNNFEGLSLIEYTISIKDKPETSFNFLIEYQTNRSSFSNDDLTNYQISDIYPNPVNSIAKIDYVFPKHYRDAKVLVRSLLGSIIVEQAFEGTQGTLNINLQDTQNGIYFYSIFIEGQIRETKKIIIKH